jgi:hypothetical protein
MLVSGLPVKLYQDERGDEHLPGSQKTGRSAFLYAVAAGLGEVFGTVFSEIPPELVSSSHRLNAIQTTGNSVGISTSKMVENYLNCR